MAAVTVGSSAVPGADAVIFDGFAGEAITINKSVYLDQTTNPPTVKLADADALATGAGMGVSLNTAPSGGVVRVQTRGKVTMSGASFTKGVPLFVGLTAGDLVPYGDLGSGDYPCYMGIPESATVLNLQPHYPGITI